MAKPFRSTALGFIPTFIALLGLTFLPEPSTWGAGIQLGPIPLDKISSSAPVTLAQMKAASQIRIRRIDPNRSPLEIRMTKGFSHWALTGSAGENLGAKGNRFVGNLAFPAAEKVFKRLVVLLPKSKPSFSHDRSGYLVGLEGSSASDHYFDDSTPGIADLVTVFSQLFTAADVALKNAVLDGLGISAIPVSPSLGTTRSGPFCSYNPIATPHFQTADAGLIRFSRLPPQSPYPLNGSAPSPELASLCSDARSLVCDSQPDMKPTFDSQCRTSQLTAEAFNPASNFLSYVPEVVPKLAPILSSLAKDVISFAQLHPDMCVAPSKPENCWEAFLSDKTCMTVDDHGACSYPAKVALKKIWHTFVTPEKVTHANAMFEEIRTRYSRMLKQRRSELSEEAGQYLDPYIQLITPFSQNGKLGPFLTLTSRFEDAYFRDPTSVLPTVLNMVSYPTDDPIRSAFQAGLSSFPSGPTVLPFLGFWMIFEETLNSDAFFLALAHELAHQFDPGILNAHIFRNRKGSPSSVVTTVEKIFGNESKPSSGLLGCLKSRVKFTPEDPVKSLRMKNKYSDETLALVCSSGGSKQECLSELKNTPYKNRVFDSKAEATEFKKDRSRGRSQTGEIFSDFMAGYALRARSCRQRNIASGQFAQMSDSAFSWVSLLHQFDKCKGSERNEDAGYDEHPSAIARQQIIQLNFDYRIATNCAPAGTVSSPAVDCSFTQTAAAFSDPTGCEVPPAAPNTQTPLEVPNQTLWTLGEVPKQTALVSTLWGNLTKPGNIPSIYFGNGGKFALFSDNGSDTQWSGFFPLGSGTHSTSGQTLSLKLTSGLTITLQASVQKLAKSRTLNVSDGKTELVLVEWPGVNPNDYLAPPPQPASIEVPLENTSWTITNWDSLDALKAIWPLNASKAAQCTPSGNCTLQFKLFDNGKTKRSFALVSGFAWSFASYKEAGDTVTFTGDNGKVLSVTKSFESPTTLILTSGAGSVRLQKQ